MSQATRVIAHRGASATHRENTLEAFQVALDQGADGIELDVRRSADDVLVVHHDAHLKDGTRLRDLAAADLPSFVPTLADTLEMVSQHYLNIEIKNAPDDPDYDAEHAISLAVAGLITAYLGGLGPTGDDRADGEGPTLRDRVIVSSFNVDSINRIGAFDPSIPLALLVWGQVDPASLIARAEAHGFDAVHPHDLLVDQAFVDRAHRAGLEVNVWTVDDPRRIVELADFGVDGVITNDPAAAIEALSGA